MKTGINVDVVMDECFGMNLDRLVDVINNGLTNYEFYSNYKPYYGFEADAIIVNDRYTILITNKEKDEDER